MLLREDAFVLDLPSVESDGGHPHVHKVVLVLLKSLLVSAEGVDGEH